MVETPANGIMIKSATLLSILLSLTFGAQAQQNELPTINFSAAMAQAEKGSVRGIREAAVLTYLQSPYGDPEKDTTKGSWEVTPQIEARMNKWTVQQATEILMQAADAVASVGGGASVDACVWKSRALKVSGNNELDDSTNFRLKPQALVRERTYRTDADACMPDEQLGECGKKFRLQAERDIVFSRLSRADREACERRISGWHLKGAQQK